MFGKRTGPTISVGPKSSTKVPPTEQATIGMSGLVEVLVVDRQQAARRVPRLDTSAAGILDEAQRSHTFKRLDSPRSSLQPNGAPKIATPKAASLRVTFRELTAFL